jgi:biotin transporter BioY
MYIVAIAWLYVISMMAITERNFTAGVLTFVFYGVAPTALLLWLAGAKRRHRAARQRESAAPSSDKQMHRPDGSDTRPDQ